MNEYHFLRLRKRHHELEREIDRELSAPLPDSIRIMEMKKEKLYLRDRLHRIWRGDDLHEARA
ncbi:MAG: YdcH family protein [Alphaproteobacteria bacterium]|nr:YdcH family protein [Alphaproteobacteria bacterium]